MRGDPGQVKGDHFKEHSSADIEYKVEEPKSWNQYIAMYDFVESGAKLCRRPNCRALKI